MSNHQSGCSCSTCDAIFISKAEKELHVTISENSRREFLKRSSRLGMGLGIGGGLIGMPTAASALQNEDAAYKENGMSKNKAVQNGKATKITLLHTADIHSQLLTHDEFFMENGKPVFKKRGGFATLKSMINTLRNQNNSNTLVIDGGDCFQGSGVASMTQGQAIIPLMNNIRYDIMLPGNWEVVYGKEMMMKDMFAYDGVKVCANMYHNTKDESNGD